MIKRMSFVLLLAVGILSAADFSGHWAGKLFKIKGGPDGPDVDDHYLVLRQTGSTVTGTAGPTRDDRFEIQNARIDGARLTFDISIPEAGMKIAYELQQSGNALTGSMVSREGPEIQAKLRFQRE